MTGRSPSGRAGRPSDQAPAGLGDTATIPSAAHTPGPWKVLPLRGKYYGTEIAIGRNGGKIVVWTCDEGETRPSFRELAEGWDEDYGFDHVETAECCANAHLIAAAPELYEALAEAAAELELLATFSRNVDATADVITRAGRALAKARGQA